MAKKKTGRIAVPFLVTIFIGLIVVGGAALFIYKHYIDKDEAPPKPRARNVDTVSYEDNHSVLLILNEPDLKCSSTFVLMRSIPKDKRLVFIGLPSNMIAVVDGKQQSLKGSFERGGGATAASFAESALGISIERYMTFGSDAFKRACDIMGCVSYPVDAEIAGLKSDGSFQNLNSEQMEIFITYSMFSGGESERAFKAASMLSYMVNGSDGKYVSDSLDNSFNTIINMTDVDSNITSVDYKNRKNAIKNMFEYGTSIAIAIQLDGTVADEDFMPSSELIKSIAEQYFSE